MGNVPVGRRCKRKKNVERGKAHGCRKRLGGVSGRGIGTKGFCGNKEREGGGQPVQGGGFETG